MICILPEYMGIIECTKKTIDYWDSLPESVKSTPEAIKNLASVADSLENGMLSKENPPIVITAILDYR